MPALVALALLLALDARAASILIEPLAPLEPDVSTPVIFSLVLEPGEEAYGFTGAFDLDGPFERPMEILLIWLFFGGVTALAAHARGRSGAGWFLLGMLFGPFALVAALVMQRLDDEGAGVAATHSRRCSACGTFAHVADMACASCGAPLGGVRRVEGRVLRTVCPTCREPVHPEARACPHCQRDIVEPLRETR